MSGYIPHKGHAPFTGPADNVPLSQVSHFGPAVGSASSSTSSSTAGTTILPLASRGGMMGGVSVSGVGGGSARTGGLVCAVVGLIGLCLGAAALHLSLQTFRPPVWLGTTPMSPSGYFYGGAVYQGSGMWVANKPVLPSARSDLVAVNVADKVCVCVVVRHVFGRL
jgi:hypothetical protein